MITRTPSEYVPSSIKDAWVFKSEKKRPESFILVQEMHYNGAEDYSDTTVQKQSYYSLLNLTAEGDTISKDEKMLSRRFGHLVDKATH